MDKLKINIFDKNFSQRKDGVSAILYKKPTNIQYVYECMDFDGISVFTDRYINSDIVDKVKSKYKIAWIIEPISVLGEGFYNSIKSLENKFDFILSSNLDFFQEDAKHIHIPSCGCWVEDADIKLYNKTKKISMICSNKTGGLGYDIRHKIYNNFKYDIDFYGLITGKHIDVRIDAFKDYMFSIVIENSKTKGYFSEKIVDCMACGTIPIYWGCNNICEYFNIDGIIEFNCIEEVRNILQSINNELYISKIESIKDNISNVDKYKIVDDYIYNKVYKKINV